MTGQILRAVLLYRRALAAAGWTARVVWAPGGAESVTWTAADGQRQVRFYRSGARVGVWLYTAPGADAVTVHLARLTVDAVHLVVDVAVRIGAIRGSEVSSTALVVANRRRGGGVA